MLSMVQVPMVRKELSQNIFLKFRPKIKNHGKAVNGIRSFAAVCNQSEGGYTLTRDKQAK